MTFTKLTAQYNFTSEENEYLYSFLYDLDAKFESTVKVGKRKVAFLKGTLHGTVFSGHPTRTTFGNSLRVILYKRYIMHKAGITDYLLYVVGDDCLLVFDRALK